MLSVVTGRRSRKISPQNDLALGLMLRGLSPCCPELEDTWGDARGFGHVWEASTYWWVLFTE